MGNALKPWSKWLPQQSGLKHLEPTFFCCDVPWILLKPVLQSRTYGQAPGPDKINSLVDLRPFFELCYVFSFLKAINLATGAIAGAAVSFF